MTSHFNEAVKVVLAHEGGFADDTADPGGATNFGISLRFAKPLGYAETADEIRNLTINQAVEIYRKEFWDTYGYERIRNARVATKLFDACVNMGPGRAHRFAQQACGVGLVLDGVLGHKSIEYINACDPDAWLLAMGACCASYYHQLAEKKPQMKKFLRGWLKRARWPLGA